MWYMGHTICLKGPALCASCLLRHSLHACFAARPRATLCAMRAPSAALSSTSSALCALRAAIWPIK
jgi:hypothetical protein